MVRSLPRAMTLSRKIALAASVSIGSLALALVLAVGYSLPVRHRATRQATYPVPPDSIFAVITAVAQFPEWRSGVRAVDSVDLNASPGRFREVSGGDAILFEVTQVVPAQRLVTRIADTSLPVGGTWTFELSPAGAGTTLRITEDGEVYNPVFRFVSRFIMGHAGGIETYLRDLGARVGASTEPQP